MPIRASKGWRFTLYIATHKISPESIFVAGGSGADGVMRGNTLAAVVANRHHEELSQLVDLERISIFQRTERRRILEALEILILPSCTDPGEKVNGHEGSACSAAIWIEPC
jgi:sucrose-phosphate synthase